MLDNIKASDRPFFLHVAYNDPHPPYFVPSPYDTMYSTDDIALPPQGNGGRPEWQYTCMKECGTDKAGIEDIKRVVSVYYGMITYVNHQMERLYRAMEEKGMLENTWFVLTSDHGDYTGEKGLFNKTESLYECLLHIPLIITPPPGTPFPKGKAYTGFTDMTDTFASILGISGSPIPEYAQGRDLVKWIKNGRREPPRGQVFSQVGNYHGGLKTTFPGGMPESGRHPSLVQGVRNHRFSYMKDPDYGDEAYDLQKDPHELTNILAGGAAPPPEVLKLKTAVEHWEQECLNLKEQLGVVPGDRGFYDGLLQERK
jgi:arylsulfatase A-like enzyme